MRLTFDDAFPALPNEGPITTGTNRPTLGTAASDLGRSEWAGSCAKCHGLQGEGDFGPKISNNALLIQAQGLEQLIRNGKNRMPPVARGWSDQQVRALLTYLKQKIYKGTPSGG